MATKTEKALADARTKRDAAMTALTQARAALTDVREQMAAQVKSGEEEVGFDELVQRERGAEDAVVTAERRLEMWQESVESREAEVARLEMGRAIRAAGESSSAADATGTKVAEAVEALIALVEKHGVEVREYDDAVARAMKLASRLGERVGGEFTAPRRLQRTGKLNGALLAEIKQAAKRAAREAA